MAVKSRRLRFAILKRDGFRCRYCGAEPHDAPLHVDHVIPVSEGGTDESENLVASCAACNLGKSNIPLDTRPDDTPTVEGLQEHARQIRGLLDAAKEVDDARAEVRDLLLDVWCDAAETESMPSTVYTRLDTIVAEHGLGRTCEALRITARRGISGTRAIQYMYGTLRRLAER